MPRNGTSGDRGSEPPFGGGGRGLPRWLRTCVGRGLPRGTRAAAAGGRPPPPPAHPQDDARRRALSCGGWPAASATRAAGSGRGRRGGPRPWHAAWAPGRAALNRKIKKKLFWKMVFSKTTACSSYVQPCLVAISGWRLAVGGWWRLAVGGWWRLPVGGWWLAVGGGWRLMGVGGWRLVVPWGGP